MVLAPKKPMSKYPDMAPITTRKVIALASIKFRVRMNTNVKYRKQVPDILKRLIAAFSQVRKPPNDPKTPKNPKIKIKNFGIRFIAIIKDANTNNVKLIRFNWSCGTKKSKAKKG